MCNSILIFDANSMTLNTTVSLIFVWSHCVCLTFVSSGSSAEKFIYTIRFDAVNFPAKPRTDLTSKLLTVSFLLATVREIVAAECLSKTTLQPFES